ncbi:SpoIIE family protein phosphatase [Streptomyces thermocarboxydovorans]
MASAGEPVPGVGALDAVFAETVRRTGASLGALYLLTPDGRMLRLEVLAGVPAEFATPWTTVSLAAPAPVAEAVRAEHLVWVGSKGELAQRYPRTAAALPYPLALAAAPVTGTRTWGSLLLMWPASRPSLMGERECHHILSSCRRLARVLEEETAGQARAPTSPGRPRVLPYAAGPTVPASAAADFAERLPGGSCALDLEGRFTFVSSAAGRLLGRDAGQLLGTQPWLTLPWLDDPRYEDRYRAAVITRQPVSFTACRPPDRWLDFFLYPDAGGISVRIVPSDSYASSAPPLRAPPADPHARVGQLYQLTHMAAALTEVVGVQDVVDLVADQVMPAFGAQGLVLSMAEAGRLDISGHRGYPRHVVERLDGLPVDTDVTPAGRALTTGVPAFFTHPEEMRRIYPKAPLISGKQAWAFLPLIISGRPVGCCVLSYDQPREFPAEERAVMTSLAGLIAQALDRARLYDTKHALAHGLQQALLPRALPAVDGLRVAARYLPATRGMDIGGDFYDLLRLSDKTAAAVIGDVQGHNAAAAALMGQVRTGVHAHATHGEAPDQVLAATNRLLTDLEPDLFTSCLCAGLDFAEGRLLMASAGHPPPVLRLPDGTTRVADVRPGPLLGIDPDAEFPVTSVPLTEGLTVVLYTDGLIETPGEDLEDSMAALASRLGQADASDLDRLADELLGVFARDGMRLDDVALLALRCGRAPAG